ncbi:TetR/AcrR family transcriptional regulator [Caldinitratiruptor microaerophilus]|uniref:HTH tetR-type domain-containing protein n=1 Tax=Caldinitratiruptor microaerophilus TaxID=671077 RepID=A0AA35CMV6_9FIRM|nr:TetR/AcrR family transcriptional regulator [Caldinitratiruptor microaerophilus]BDG60492.1 hypothetical protein caldi_15820 [Caldinitratiruptor microaerophilus]
MGLQTAAESLRNQIVSAALQLFLEKGYHSTSLQDIITAANCSKGGFYHHFASKDDLLYLIHETFITYELERGEAVRSQPGPAAERLRQVIVDLVESIALYRPHVTVFFEERRSLSSEKFALVKQKRDRYEALVRELVEEGMRSGEFRQDLDPRIVTFAIFGMCNWTYQWLRPDGPLTPRQVGEMFSSLILQGLRS